MPRLRNRVFPPVGVTNLFIALTDERINGCSNTSIEKVSAFTAI